MAADMQKTHRRGPVAIGQRPVAHLVLGHHLPEFAPERDAFEQRPRRVHPRQAVAQRRIHVEMRVDEGRRDQIARRIDPLPGLGRAEIAQRRDPVAADADVGHPPVRQGAARDDDIEHHRSPLLKGVISAAGTSARRDIATSARIDSR